jgi:hypothetical protein
VILVCTASKELNTEVVNVGLARTSSRALHHVAVVWLCSWARQRSGPAQVRGIDLLELAGTDI